MKNFIKISFVTLALLLATNVSAQLLPISMGLKGGVNLSSTSPKDSKSKAGYNAGLTLDVNLPGNLAIMSGLELTTKGAKQKHISGTMNAMYLQLPVHLGYRMGVLPGLRLHFDLGPYFAQGIGGKTNFGGNKVNTFGSKGLDMKKFDWGLGIGVGVTFLGKIQVRAGYDHGFENIAASGSEGGKVRNRNAYLSAGFLFF